MSDPGFQSLSGALPSRRRLIRQGMAGLVAAGCAATQVGCGFRPVHDSSGGTTRDALPAFDIPVIEGREGQLVRNALLHRLTYDPEARYRLDVGVSMGVQGLGIQRDDEASLRRLNGNARFQVRDRTLSERISAMVGRARETGGSESRPGEEFSDVVLQGSVRLSALYNVFGDRYPSEASRRGATRDLAEGLAEAVQTRLMGYFSGRRGTGSFYGGFPRL